MASDGMTLNADEVAALRELLDRQAIIDCVHRYARGMDRGDEELLRSAYHDDAEEDHGAYVGGVEGLLRFLAWAHKPFPGYQRYVTNFVIEVDGDEAHCESTYLCVLRRGDDQAGLLVNGGRYVDRLSRRDGSWRILRRVVVVEWEGTIEGGSPRHQFGVEPRSDRGDISYLRPLGINRTERSPM